MNELYVWNLAAGHTPRHPLFIRVESGCWAHSTAPSLHVTQSIRPELAGPFPHNSPDFLEDVNGLCMNQRISRSSFSTPPTNLTTPPPPHSHLRSSISFSNSYRLYLTLWRLHFKKIIGTLMTVVYDDVRME